MNSIRAKTYVVRLYLMVFILFMVNKFGIRPFVLEHDLAEFIQIIVLSLPNTFEAIIGMTNVTGLLVAAKLHFSPRFDRTPNLVINLLATLLTGAYVLTQEFKIHNLGGRNIYDPYDVAASLIGLVGMFLVFSRFGIIERVNANPGGK